MVLRQKVEQHWINQLESLKEMKESGKYNTTEQLEQIDEEIEYITAKLNDYRENNDTDNP